MKKLFTLCVVIVAALSSLSAQSTAFHVRYGNQPFTIPYGIQQTADGGYIQCGYVSDGISYDAWLMKTSNTGTVTWSKKYHGNGDCGFYDVTQTSDGGFIACGTFVSSVGSVDRALVVKTNSTGDTLWTRQYGTDGEDFNQVIQCTDGGYAFAGTTNSYANGASNDIYVVKTTSSGNIEWMKGIGIPDSVDWGGSIQQTADQGFIVCGTVRYSAGKRNAYLARFNATGDTLWTRVYLFAEDLEALDVIVTTDGGFMLACNTLDFATNDHDILLIKTDASGLVTWAQTYATQNDEEPCNVFETTNGYHIGGYQENNSYNYDALFIRVGTGGALLWSNAHGTSDDEEVFGMCKTSDGGFIGTGYMDKSGSPGIVYGYTIKTQSNGYAAGCNAGTASIISNSATIQTTRAGAMDSGNELLAGGITASDAGIVDSTYCYFVGIEESDVNSQLSVYPNPTTGLVTLDLGDAQNFSEIKIYNSIGGLVGSENVKSVSGKVIIDLSKYGKGLFFLTSSNAEKTFSVKVLVE
ncbi:MAG: T9SS type A sorting domain-containing protein [Bacteroidota bacterium]